MSEKKTNYVLLLFDLLLLPIHIIRLIIIYFWSSKYNLKGFQFLDVIMHSDKIYFNQDDCRIINTVGQDYRIIIRDDSRLFLLDLDKHIEIKRNEDIQKEKTHSESELMLNTTQGDNIKVRKLAKINNRKKMSETSNHNNTSSSSESDTEDSSEDESSDSESLSDEDDHFESSTISNNISYNLVDTILEELSQFDSKKVLNDETEDSSTK